MDKIEQVVEEAQHMLDRVEMLDEKAEKCLVNHDWQGAKDYEKAVYDGKILIIDCMMTANELMEKKEERYVR